MIAKVWQKRSWCRKILFGTVLALAQNNQLLHAQMAPTEQVVAVQNVPPIPGLPSPTLPSLPDPNGTSYSSAGSVGIDPFAPAWADPISRVPNFFGDFFARDGQATRAMSLPPQTLTYTGVGGEGAGFTLIPAPITINGPGGPYTLTHSIPVGTYPNFSLSQNLELTSLVQSHFPGAAYVDGGGSFLLDNSSEFLYHYLFTSSSQIHLNLANPSGGGLVGRNDYYDNGSAVPQDRVYFFYNHVGSVQGLGNSFDVNRYVVGAEKTFLDNLFSVEVRVPFAGTANSDQTVGQPLAVDHAQFGNIGLALKGVLYRTPNFIASVGMGLSLPTADDSRLLVNGIPVVAIRNEAVLLQPMLGVAWAPNDRLYAQAGVQFDVDPSGNKVQGLNSDGVLSTVGRLHDQSYAYLKGATGYWIYQNTEGPLTGIALQSELNFDRSFGPGGSVQDNSVSVSGLGYNSNVFTGSLGAILRFQERLNVSFGVSCPLGGDHLYSWNAVAQLNYQFGAPR